jgi:hypothetical protein
LQLLLKRCHQRVNDSAAAIHFRERRTLNLPEWFALNNNLRLSACKYFESNS